MSDTRAYVRPIRAFVGGHDRRAAQVGALRLGEQNGFVVLGTIEDVQDVHGINADLIENQVIAMGELAPERPGHAPPLS